MHITSADFVSIKTAFRQAASRLEGESSSLNQWSNLVGHRGLDEVAPPLTEAKELVDNAVAKLNEAAELVFQAQEHESSHESTHHDE